MTVDKPIRVGINGFGRIGRLVARQILSRSELQLVAVNDKVADLENLAYLFNYDSTYGRSDHRMSVREGLVTLCGEVIQFSCKSNVSDVNWTSANVDILIESSGVQSNVALAKRTAQDQSLSKILVTHVPSSGIDRYVIYGINEDEILDSDNVISTGICDANAIAHPIDYLNRVFGVVSGTVTTLHPWLSYQNLTDNAVWSQSVPAHPWKDYALGRASPAALIPKNTTAVSALQPILGELSERISGFSVRVPTQTVCCAELQLRLKNKLTLKELRQALQKQYTGSGIVNLETESLTSVDYERSEASATIDCQWLDVIGEDTARMVLWYDNEWGYAARVLDVADKCAKLLLGDM